MTVAWNTWQKLTFRLLFTVGGGILILSVYGNLGLAVVFGPLLQALADLGSFVVRGEGVHLDIAGEADSLAAWCYHLGWILVALLITAVWTVLDRRRTDYRRLAALLHVFARFGLAISMLVYGLAKFIPAQMAYMTLPGYQVQMVGDVSLMNVLWGFMGASDPYTMAAGAIEFASGALLLWRRTWLLGALLAIFAMGQVFLLNLCYDVPVKLVSGQLLIVAIAVTAPYWRPLIRVVLRGETPQPVPQRLRRSGTVVKFVIAAAVVVLTVTGGVITLREIHHRRSDVDGVWTATSFSIDGKAATLDQVSPAPWTNVAITDRDGDYTSFVTQVPAGYVTVYDYQRHDDRLELKRTGTDSAVVLNARQDGPDRLVLTGTVDGKAIEGHYRRRFLQRTESHFRLVQPDVQQNPAARLP